MINSLSGFKSANLIGTVSKEGQTNLALVSSVVHLGANPPLMAFVLRPHSEESPRHTLLNLKEISFFTINHVAKSFYKQAHQTSANFPKEISEFSACGFNEEFRNSLAAPYVKESDLQIGLKLKEILDIPLNKTHFVIGEIIEFFVNDAELKDDGYIDIETLDSVCVSGLDRYHTTKSLARLSYAKPNKEICEIPLSGERELKPHS